MIAYVNNFPRLDFQVGGIIIQFMSSPREIIKLISLVAYMLRKTERIIINDKFDA